MQECVDEFFATARERYSIYLLRQDTEAKPPFTEDKAMLEWRFCNVFREDDKVTQWIRHNVRQRLRNDKRALLAMVICRLFNKIETLQLIQNAGLFDHWDSDECYQLLKDVHPIVGAAYVVRSHDGMDKLRGILCIINDVSKDVAMLARMYDKLEELWKELMQYKCLGKFMAYEIVSDLRHTRIAESASDIMTWANAGPGACLGLSWLLQKNLTCLPYGTSASERIALQYMRELLQLSRQDHYWPLTWPQWEMREVEHWLCEYSKWVKVTHLGQRMKRRYQGENNLC